MNRKKLTKNQQRRILENQQDINSNNSSNSQSPEKGLIVCHYGKRVDIENSLNSIIKCNLRQNLPSLAVGDNVIYETIVPNQQDSLSTSSSEPKTELKKGVITKLLPRKSLLERKSLSKTIAKPIAANVDQLFIIFASEPKPQTYLIDQFLIIAENCNIKPILIFNKYDLYQNLSSSEKQELDNLLDIYANIGYTILTISGLFGKNSSQLNNLLTDKTSIFVGQSGVGKSTITQQLVPNIHIATGAISEKSQLGKHTTTTAKLYHLANNGNLIDAPGIREMGVAHLSKTQIEQAYVEFRPFLNNCKFNDCEHNKEPDCALKSALSDGKINKVRWDNYKKLIQVT